MGIPRDRIATRRKPSYRHDYSPRLDAVTPFQGRIDHDAERGALLLKIAAIKPAAAADFDSARRTFQFLLPSMIKHAKTLKRSRRHDDLERLEADIRSLSFAWCEMTSKLIHPEIGSMKPWVDLIEKAFVDQGWDSSISDDLKKTYCLHD